MNLVCMKFGFPLIYVFNYDEQKEIHMDSMAPAERDMQRKRLGRPVFLPRWLPKKSKPKMNTRNMD
jgi:hypothetical protein